MADDDTVKIARLEATLVAMQKDIDRHARRMDRQDNNIKMAVSAVILSVIGAVMKIVTGAPL